MESRILGFVDAMRLAKLLSPHLPPITSTTTILEVVQELVTKISPMEFVEVVRLLTGQDKLEVLSGMEYVSLVSDGLVKNKIPLLMEAYKKYEEQ